MNKEHRYLQRLQERAAMLAEPEQNKIMTKDDYDHIFQALHQVFGLSAAKSFTQLCCYLKDGRAATVRKGLSDLHAHKWSLASVLELQECVDQEKRLSAFNAQTIGFSKPRSRSVDRYHLHYAANMNVARHQFLQDHFLQLSLEQKNSLPANPPAPQPSMR